MPKTATSKPAPDQAVPLPPVEEIAQAIVDIGAGMKKLLASRLNRAAIVTLLFSQCSGKVNRSQINLVLNELERMDKVWLKKELK